MSAATQGRNAAGFGLLEVLISIVILSVAASILVVSTRTAVAGQERSKVYGDAATATWEVLESIRLLPLDSISRLKDAVVPHSQEGTVIKATARPLAAGDVTDISRLDTTNLRHLTLRTTFKSQAGSWVTKTFTTILYQP